MHPSASVSLLPLPRSSSGPDIDCPGDTISFSCSIQSNSETIHLTWQVNITGQMPVNITYDAANTEETVLNDFITTSLNNISSGYLESTLVFTVQPSISQVTIMLECFIEGLGNESAVELVNISGKLCT